MNGTAPAFPSSHWFKSKMRWPTYREPYVRRYHPYFRTSPSQHETTVLLSEVEYQKAMADQPRSSFALPSFIFEDCEIEVVPSAPGSGDALDVQTVAGRRRLRLLTEYLLMCLHGIRTKKRAEVDLHMASDSNRSK
ncbi:uncharacterized protein STEHIDRAFT_166047 [Stereum hirsutum FP-91666 SS1]|uniref:uncharacterized protein n=1 Tax=Stereum hirsutum (strain FP-91666) TaxID=721885 RepID=UPI000440F477|nr:uncharacterized protein STEHIDRAFT_166047 [Stereum hirsutum FP-91666 SS1]EIM89696.1 hypothetical protein STEHIDRAFT_166047 [Stereum hirsutum FP-91666 SS1]